MIDNSFSMQRGIERLIRAKKGLRPQEDIISDLKLELENISELALLKHSMRLIVELDNRKTSELYINLESPMKQALYLIDVFYSMGNKGGTDVMTPQKEQNISILLDEMELAYFSSIAFPNDGDVFHDDRDEKIHVSLSSFLHHFSNAKLCYEEQTLDRIVRYFKPYDNWINSKYGFRIDDAIKFILHVRYLNNQKFSNTIHKGNKFLFYASHPKEWQKLTGEFTKRGLEPDEWADQPELEGIFDAFTTNPGDICLHSREEIEEVNLAENVKKKLLDFFVYNRKLAEQKEIIYYADNHLSEERPLFCIADQFICPINKFLLEALYNRLSADLQKNVSKFKQHKDHDFELKVYELFKSFLPEKAKIFQNYSIDGTSENYLLIGLGTTWLIVEIKNTGFRTPMRDPLKAYDKIKSDFEKSVQLGYEQCKRVEEKFFSGSDICIQDAKNNKSLFKIKANRIADVWSIVVTDYNYGAIQTDLSNLLKKEDEALYPWSVCADDLEIIMIMMKKLFKGIAPARFFEYLDYRERYHGHVSCFDEMELGGWYLCSREQFKKYADYHALVNTLPEMGEIFDAYYKIGLGFHNELDISVKRNFKLPEYSREFEMTEINRADIPRIQ